MDRTAFLTSKVTTVGGRPTGPLEGVAEHFQRGNMKDRVEMHDIEAASGGALGADGASGRRIVVYGGMNEPGKGVASAAAASERREAHSFRSPYPPLKVVHALDDRGTRPERIPSQLHKRVASDDGEHARKRFRDMTTRNFSQPVVTAAQVQGIREFNETERQQISQRLLESPPDEYIEKRPGPGGKEIFYIQGGNVIKLANEVFGFDGWSFHTVTSDVMFVDEDPSRGGFSACVSVHVRVTIGGGTVREDCGGGHCKNVADKNEAVNRARKEAVTDGCKRALRSFGPFLGLNLNSYTYNQYRTASRF